MKRNNDSVHFKDWTTKKLKDEALGYDQLIHEIGCYGSHDIQNLDGILNELSSRGIDAGHSLKFN